MVIYRIACDYNLWTWEEFLRNLGSSLAGRVVDIPIHMLAGVRDLRVGTYIFQDQEITTPEQRALLSQVWDCLEQDGRCKLLNHPTRFKRRYDLLKALETAGNSYRCFHVWEVPKDLRYPIFVRLASDHRGSRTELLHSLPQLQAAVEAALIGVAATEEILVIEFCDTSGGTGLYRKMGSFIVDGEPSPPLVDRKRHWMVKGGGYEYPPDHLEEWEELQKHVHREDLARAARLANVDFGRIDFAIQGGKIEVWEINSNPEICVPPEKWNPVVTDTVKAYAAWLADRLERIDTPFSRSRIPIHLDPERIVRTSREEEPVPARSK